MNGRGEDGQWHRDEMMEFDSDEEPQCVDGKIIIGRVASSNDNKPEHDRSSRTVNEVPSAVGTVSPHTNTTTHSLLVFLQTRNTCSLSGSGSSSELLAGSSARQIGQVLC